MADQQIVITVDINAQGATVGVNNVNDALNRIVQHTERIARSSALSFEQLFGANFFADLASRAVAAFKAGFQNLIGEAIAAASRLESAFAGVRGVARNVGISQDDAVASVKNLDLVRSGLLTVGDAATSLKNLLATGFGLQESIDLIKAFGDTAAFGRQASLTYGYAIASATEGIKNQNSILVDNAGLTKNLSVILKERGFQIQDLSDKLNGAAAREALHTGLLKEASLAHGDSTRVLETYQGRLIQVESAQTRFLASLGESITKNQLVVASLGLVVRVLDAMAAGTGGVVALAAAVALLTVAIIAMNTTALVQSIPLLSNLIASVSLLGKVMTGTASLVAGHTATLALAATGYGAIALAAGGLLYVLYKSATATKEYTDVSQAHIDALVKQRDQYERQSKALSSITREGESNAEVQKGLAEVYNSLNSESKTRVNLLDDEAGRARALADELQRLNVLRNDELQIIARTTTAELVTKLDELNQKEARINALEQRIGQLRQIEQEVEAAGARGSRGDVALQARYANDPVFSQIANSEQSQRLEFLARASANAHAEVAKLRGEITEASPAAEQLARKQEGLAKTLNTTASGLVTQADQYHLLNTTGDRAQQLVADFNAGLQAQANALNDVRSPLQRYTDELNLAADAAERIAKGRRGRVQDALTAIVEQAVAEGTPADEVRRQLSRAPLNVAGGGNFAAEQLREDAAAERRARDIRRAAEEALGLVDPKKERKARGQESELDRLSKSLVKLTGEVASFTQLTSREFELRFKVESLERVKRDFETILTLRRELGLKLDERLPSPLDTEGIRLTIESLEHLKRYRDDVRKVTDEARDADLAYAVALKTVSIPVVNAGVLAETAYLKAVRERRNAEQELTADLIKLSRLRRDALADEVGQTATAYLTLKRDLLQQVETLRGDVLREGLLQQIERGGTSFELEVENKLSGRVEVHQPSVPKELTNIEAHVRSIAERMPAPAAGGSTATAAAFSAREFLPTLRAFLTTRGLNPDTYLTAVGQTGTHNRLNLDHRNAIDVGLNPASAHGKALVEFLNSLGVKNRPITAEMIAAGVKATAPHVHVGEPSRGTGRDFRPGTLLDAMTRAATSGASAGQPSTESLVERVKQAALNVLGVGSVAELATPQGALTVLQRLGEFLGAGGDPVETVTTNRVGGTVTDLVRERDRLTAQGNIDRPRNERDARIRVEEIQLELEAAQSSAEKQLQFERDVYDARLQFNRQRRDDYRKTAVDIAVMSSGVAQAEARDAEFVARVQQKAVQEHIAARIALNERAVQLDFDIAHAADNASLEYEVAWKEAIYSVERADIEANKRRIAADVELADKSVFHADRANAKVVEYLAAQRGITDVVADFRIGVVETTYKFIDDGLDRITRKLGVIGDLIRDLLSGLIRIALNAAFRRLFGGESSGAGGSILNLGGGGSGGSSSGGSILDLFLRGGSRATGTPPFVAGAQSGAGALANFLGAPSGSTVQLGAQQYRAIGGGLFPVTPSAFSTPYGSSANAALTSAYGAATGVGTGLTSAYTQAGQEAYARTLIHEAAHAQAGTVASAAAPTFGQSIAPALPLLGLSLGSTLGGAFFQHSRAANVIGTVAGGAVGLAAGLAGYGALAGGFGGLGGLAGAAGAIAGALPIIAPIAAVALIGAYFLNRNAERRRNETTRDQLTRDSNKALDDLIAALRAGRISGDDALAQALQVRANYMTEASKISDSKTRRHALLTVRELDYRIDIIKRLAPIVDNAQDIDERLVPTFGGGGRFNLADFSGRGLVSQGGYDGRDRYAVAIADDETIVSPRDRAALGGHEAFRRAGIRGYAGGGGNTVTSPAYTPRSTGGGGAPSKIVVVQVTDERYADELIAQLSSRGEGVLAVKVGNQVERDGTNGLAGRIAAQFE